MKVRRAMLAVVAVIVMAVPPAAATAEDDGAQFYDSIRQLAVHWQRLDFGEKVGMSTWARYTMNPGQSHYDGFVFRTPPGEPRDLFWAFAVAKGSHFRSWYILAKDPKEVFDGFRHFYEFDNGGVEDAQLPAKNRLFLQALAGTDSMLRPDTEYIIYLYFGQSSDPESVWATMNLVPHGKWEDDHDSITEVLGLRPTGVHMACAVGSAEQVAKVLEADPAALESRDAEQKTALHVAVDWRRPAIAELLLRRGANPNAQLPDGATALRMAVENRDAEMAQTLLQHGADVNIPDAGGQTPVHAAATVHDMGLLRLVCEHRPNLAARLGVGLREGCTPLHMAIHEHDTAAAGYLVEMGAPSDAKDARGRVPLHLAAAYGETEVARALLEKGASASAPDRRGFTPLTYAVRNGQTAVVALLREHGGAEAPAVAGAPAQGQEPEEDMCPRLLLNGRTSYLVVEHNASLDFTGSFTAELWVCLNRHNTGTPAAMTRDNPDLGPWEMALENGRLTTKVADGNWSPTPPETAYGPLPLGQWLHLAMVHDGGQVRVYVGGKKVAQYAAPAMVKVTGNDLKIGRSLYTEESLDGLVGEVRISDSARYTDDFTPQWRCDPDGHTIVLLHCDEAKGRIARDSSGKGNDAGIIDGQWVLP